MSDAFDFYPKSGAIEIDEAVTLRCNGSSTNGTKRTAAVWLRRTLHDDGDGVDVRRIDDATYYHLTVDSLRIARFDANYVGQYACRRGPDGPIGDWVTLKLRSESVPLDHTTAFLISALCRQKDADNARVLTSIRRTTCGRRTTRYESRSTSIASRRLASFGSSCVITDARIGTICPRPS